MNMAARIGAVLILASAAGPTAQAQGFFVGVEGGKAIYPDLRNEAMQSMRNSGFTSATAAQNTHGTVYGIYAGKWLTENFGVEISSTNLVHIRGDVSGTIRGVSTSSYYEYHGWLPPTVSVALLGAQEMSVGKLYGKVGYYGSAQTYVSPTRNTERHSEGPVLGGGYYIPLMKHLSGKVEMAVYKGFKFQLFDAPAGVASRHNVKKFSIGLAFTF